MKGLIIIRPSRRSFLKRLCLPLFSACIALAGGNAFAQGFYDIFGGGEKKQEIAVSDLPKIRLDDKGILTDNSKFPDDMWFGSEYGLIATVMPKLPAGTGSAAMRDLIYRLVLSPARAPMGTSAMDELFNIRLNIIMRMGYGAEALKMLDILPNEYITEDYKRKIAVARLMAGEDREACETVQEMLAESNLLFWQEAHILCLGIEGRNKEAELAIQLMEEEGYEATLPCCNVNLKDIIREIGNENTPPLQEMADEPSPLGRIMLEKAGFIKKPEEERPDNAQFYAPLVMIEGGKTIWQPENLQEWWQKESSLSAEQKTAVISRYLTILESIDVSISADEWETIPNSAFAYKEYSLPPTTYLRRMERAASYLRVGEAVLYSMLVLGEQGPADSHEIIVAKVISSLWKIGLKEDAKKIAAEAILNYRPN